MVLLDKARLAFNAGASRGGQDERAQRVLQRLWRMTDDSSLAAASTAAAQSRDAVAVPVVASGTDNTSHNDSEAGWTLPLLAPELAAAAASTPAALPALPTAKQPPLFLVLNNLGLVHLRAGRLAISCIFFARALEHAQSLLSSIAPPTPSAAESGASTRSAKSGAHSTLSPLDGAHSRPTQLSPSPALAARSLASSSPPRSAIGGGTSGSDVSLYAFLLAKSLDVFYNAAVALLQRQADGSGSECCSLSSDAAESTCALQLAARCLLHCLQLPRCFAWSQLSPSLLVAASQKLLFAPARLAECVLLLHRRHAAVAPNRGVLSSSPDAAAETADVSALLSSAIPPLRDLLSQLSIDGDAHAQVAAATPGSPLNTLRQRALLLLAEVQLTTGDASSALATLRELLTTSAAASEVAKRANSSPAPDSITITPVQRLKAEMLQAEAQLLLLHPHAALETLRSSRTPLVRQVLLACGLEAAPDSGAAGASADPLLSRSEQHHLRVSTCAAAAHALLASGRAAEAKRCLRAGFNLQPSDSQLLRLEAFLRLRNNETMSALTLLKQPNQSSAAQA